MASYTIFLALQKWVFAHFWLYFDDQKGHKESFET